MADRQPWTCNLAELVFAILIVCYIDNCAGNPIAKTINAVRGVPAQVEEPSDG